MLEGMGDTVSKLYLKVPTQIKNRHFNFAT